MSKKDPGLLSSETVIRPLETRPPASAFDVHSAETRIPCPAGGGGPTLSPPSAPQNTRLMSGRDPMMTLREAEQDVVASALPMATEFRAISLRSVLGKGGMGIVHLGHQTLPPREVAIKKAHQSIPNLQQLLLREAVVTGMLEHPNIVPVHEIRSSEDGELAIVMKRIRGLTLREFMQQNPVGLETIGRCVEALIQVCNALSFGHERGVVHRDVKLDNIMVGTFGETYLLDWGLAVELSRSHEVPEALVGTLAYMPPEMLSGVPADCSPKTDIFLLGATLHEALVGAPRYTTAGDELLQQIKVCPSFEFGEQVPRQLANLANYCCARDPKERPASMAEVREELQDYLEKRHALVLFQAGQSEISRVEKLIGGEKSKGPDRLRMYRHMHRARFGFEQALKIDPSLTEAREALVGLVDRMTLMLLDDRNAEAASWFVESSGILSTDVRSRLDQALEDKEKADVEATRLQELGALHDPSKSRVERLFLTLSLCFGMAIMALDALRYQSLHNVVDNRELLREGLCLLFPVGIALALRGRSLFSSAVGRRASVGIVGGVVCIILNRWAGVVFDLPVGPIITADKFIVAMAFANTPPALASGRYIAGLAAVAGIASILNPATQLPGSLLLIVGMTALVLVDLSREWRDRLDKGE